MVPQYPTPIERRAMDWRVSSNLVLAGEGSVRTSTLLAFSDVQLGVLLHVGPPVASANSSLRQ